jgi:D-tyrosyl-tRNA(Tyr) deacylase
MIGLLQRVTSAEVRVDGECIASIARGMLVLIGVERMDGDRQVQRLADRLLNYRVFPDAAGKMNQNILQTSGSMLLVPQFTLVADTNQGNRPGFSRAADPARAEALFCALVSRVEQELPSVGAGRFGADMAVSLINDGPVTFSLQVPPDV